MKINFISPLFILIVFSLIMVAYLLWRKASREKDYAYFKTYLFYLFGASLIALLVFQLPVEIIMKSFKKIGWGIIYSFSTGIIWFLFLGLSLYTMFGFSIGYTKILYIQFVGEGFNIMIPSGGLVGEIIKIQRSSKETTIDKAAVSVIFDRLTHITSSTIMAALSGHLSFILIPMEAQIKQTILIISIVFYLIFIALIVIALSKIVEKVIALTLKRLKLSKTITITLFENQKRKFILSLFYRTLGRALWTSEYCVILFFLDLPLTGTLLLAITTGISISASAFFMVPQGLGVNEAGVAGAFSVLGMDPALGVAIALIRRARILFWGVCGVSVYSLEFFISKYLSYSKKKKDKKISEL